MKTIKEKLKTIPGFKRYLINNNGTKIWDTLKERLINIYLNDRYLKAHIVAPDGDRKLKMVHRLVALSWVENPLNLPEVNHDDGNRLNNYYKNLIWNTRVENREHAKSKGLIEKDEKGRFKKPDNL